METDMQTSSGDVRIRSTLLTLSGNTNLKYLGSDADKVIVRFSSILIIKLINDTIKTMSITILLDDHTRKQIGF